MHHGLKSLTPVSLFTVKDPRDPEDYGMKMSVLQYENGFKLCKYRAKTKSSTGVSQSLFPTAQAAEMYARQRYMCGDRWE